MYSSCIRSVGGILASGFMPVVLRGALDLGGQILGVLGFLLLPLLLLWLELRVKRRVIVSYI
jgi:hypothetical protein